MTRQEKDELIKFLQLMLTRQDLYKAGLCTWAGHLYGANLITYGGRVRLRDYISNNRPSKFSSLDAYKCRKSGFYWSIKKLKPRLKWIHKHIKLLSKD